MVAETGLFYINFLEALYDVAEIVLMEVLTRQVILHFSLKLLVDFHLLSVRWFTVTLCLCAVICSLFSVALNSTYEHCTIATVSSVRVGVICRNFYFIINPPFISPFCFYGSQKNLCVLVLAHRGQGLENGLGREAIEAHLRRSGGSTNWKS